MIMYVKTQNGGTLNLRQSASTSSAILAQIPNGAKLEAETANDTWSKVSDNNKVGYVMTKYLAEASTVITDKTKLQAIYNSLKETLSLIEDALK